MPATPPKNKPLMIGEHVARWCDMCRTWRPAAEFTAKRSALCDRYHGSKPGSYERQKLAEYTRPSGNPSRKIDGAPELLSERQSAESVPRNTVARRR